jgi:hypothetical protein
VAAVKSGMSIQDVENEFGIPKSTICDNASCDHDSVMGQPPKLNEVKEIMLKELVMLLADWGFPFPSVDLCNLVKSYLTRRAL